MIWVGLLVCRACLWPKSRLWPCERPVETPDKADLAVATTVHTQKSSFGAFASALGEGLGGVVGVLWGGLGWVLSV